MSNRAARFTEKHLEAAIPGKLLFVWDTPGLYFALGAGPRRKARWILRFSRPDKSGPTTRSLGPYPAVTLEMAKNRATHNRLMIQRDKVDPWKVAAEDGSQKTFGDVVELWMRQFDSLWKTKPEHRRKKREQEIKLLLLTHAKPLHDMKIINIKPKHISEALKPLWDRAQSQGERTLAKIEAVFGFAKTSQWYFGDNPAIWKGTMENMLPRASRVERPHFPAMPYEMVPNFVHELRQRQDRSVGAVALEVAILTGGRTSEVLKMQWSELDLDHGKVWTIPGIRMKAGRTHQVPLVPRVIELLRRQLEQNPNSEFVFTGYSRSKPLNDKAMRDILFTIYPGYSVHGFRTSFRDFMGDETDFARETTEECLSHRVGGATENAYRRRTAFEKRKAIMFTWESYCASGPTNPHF
jgi:integrase